MEWWLEPTYIQGNIKEWLSAFILFYQLVHYIGVFKQMAEARKTTMGHITQDHLRQSTIVLPPDVDIANKLEEKLCPIFDAIVKNSQEIMTLTKQRDELLPLLMNGQATVKLSFIAIIRLLPYIICRNKK